METTMQGIRFRDITPTMENQMEKKSNRHGNQHCSYAACIYVPLWLRVVCWDVGRWLSPKF